MEAKIEMLKTGSLKPYPKNSRTHSAEQIAQIVASISEFGWTNPILIDKKNGIIAGHGRWEAAKSMGMDEVPCVRLNMTAKQARAYVIGDNKLAELAGWDEGILKEELAALLDMNFDVSLIGFDDEAVTGLLNERGEETTSSGSDAGDLTQVYIVELHLTTEHEQQKFYEEMNERGVKCRILTL